MYEVDGTEQLVELRDVPQSEPGAPCPVVVADEHRVVLAYYVATQDREPDRYAILVFERCGSHMFGPPNDEALQGHPLWAHGLRHYGAYEVRRSSWIRCLEQMNSVHHLHSPERFKKLRHLVFSFHDSTFECVCESFDVRTSEGSILEALSGLARLLTSR